MAFASKKSRSRRIRIVSWNLERGRAAGTWQAIARDCAADLVLLQETPKPQSDGLAHWQPVRPQLWGSAVVAMNGQLERVEVAQYRGWVTGARWSRGTKASTEDVYVFSVHSPTHHQEAPRHSYIRESRMIVDRIVKAVPRNARLVVGGDFNFASFGERADGERLATKPAERDALDDFRSKGFLVAWRDLHPAAPLPQTLRWSGDRTTPFHCDGYLVRGFEASRLACEVLAREQLMVMSDHLPVTLVYGERSRGPRFTRGAALREG
jgi:endonuclease/exonuclease/phosphatase family metal-dependent hydrolase